MDSFFADLIHLSGKRGLFLFKTPKTIKMFLDLKILNFLFEIFRKKKKIFSISSSNFNSKIRIYSKWESMRRKVLGIYSLDNLELSCLTVQILNEIIKHGFQGIYQYQLAKNFNLKSSHINHHLAILKNLKLVFKMNSLTQKIFRISNPILLMGEHFFNTKIIQEKKNLSFQIPSKENEFFFLKNLVNIIIRQKKNIGQKNLKYGILFQQEKFKKKDKKKIHRVWQKLRERLIKSDIVLFRQKESKMPKKKTKKFIKNFFHFKKNGVFLIPFFSKQFSLSFWEIKFLLTITPNVQIQKILKINQSAGINFPFLVDKFKGLVNPRTIHSFMKSFEISRGLSRKFEQIGRQRIVKFTLKVRSNSTNIQKDKSSLKSLQVETVQIVARRLNLLSWVDSHVLVLKDLGKKMAFFEKKGLKRIDSKVIRRILSELIKLGRLKIVKIRVRINLYQTKEIEFITKSQFDSRHLKKIPKHLTFTDSWVEEKIQSPKKKKPENFKKKDRPFISSYSFLLFPGKFIFFSKKGFGYVNLFLYGKNEKKAKRKYYNKPFLFSWSFKKNFFIGSRVFLNGFFQKENLFNIRKKNLDKLGIKKDLKIPKKNPSSTFLPGMGKKIKCGFSDKEFFFEKPQWDRIRFLSAKLYLFSPLRVLVKIFKPFPIAYLKIIVKGKIPDIKILPICYKKKISNKGNNFDFLSMKTQSRNKWDCELDVKLVQSHIFKSRRIKTSMNDTWHSDFDSSLRRLKGISKLENVKFAKFYYQKCIQFSKSRFLKFLNFNLIHLIKRTLEFPNNYFFFDLEIIQNFKLSLIFQKKKHKLKTLKKKFFLITLNFFKTTSLASRLFSLILSFERVFLFFFAFEHFKKIFYFFIEINCDSFFKSKIKKKMELFDRFLFSFKDFNKFFKFFQIYKTPNNLKLKTSLSDFFSDFKFFFIFKNLRQNNSFFFPLILKQKLNSNLSFDQFKEKRIEKMGNIIEIRILKKKGFLNTKKLFFLKNSTNKFPNFETMKDKIVYLIKTKSYIKKKSKRLKKILVSNFKFLNRCFFEKKLFFSKKVGDLNELPVGFILRNLPFWERFPFNLKLLDNRSFQKNKIFKKKDLLIQKAKLFLLNAILKFSGKEINFFENLIYRVPLPIFEKKKVFNLLFLENRIFCKNLYLKSSKFSTCWFEKISMTRIKLRPTTQNVHLFSI